MITTNFKDVRKSLEDYKKLVEKKLTYMVRTFAYSVVETSINNTPLGDADKYVKLYQLRQRSLGLEPKEGFAQGSWQVQKDSSKNIQAVYSGTTALSLADSALMQYKLGDRLYITNTGYYIGKLEEGKSNQAPLGIMKPTTDQIVGVLQNDLVRYFNEG